MTSNRAALEAATRARLREGAAGLAGARDIAQERLASVAEFRLAPTQREGQTPPGLARKLNGSDAL